MQGLNNQNYNPGGRPKTLICYICGREYGTKSLEIHLKTCQEKFLMEEAKKPKNQRRPLPQPPKAIGGSGNYDTESYNEQAFSAYKEQSLEKCAYCGRTFNRESYPIHLKICKPDKPFKPLPGFVQNPKEVQQQMNRDNGGAQQGKSNSNGYSGEYKAPVRPKTLVCYICGREYGTKSLGIHIPQCKEMFIVQEMKKPKAERRNPPTTPRGLWDLLNKEDITMEDIIAYNNGAFNKYNKEALVACKNCGRTFKPEALEHHVKACTADNPFKALDAVEEGGTVELVPCKKCGRKFLPSRVEKHESNCKDIKGASQTQANGFQKQQQQQQQQQQYQQEQNQIFETPQQNQKQQSKQVQKQQSFSKTSVNFNDKSLKCYKCFQDCNNVQDLKQHVQNCKNQGMKPQIYDDLIQIPNPSQALQTIYMSSVFENFKKDDHKNQNLNEQPKQMPKQQPQQQQKQSIQNQNNYSDEDQQNQEDELDLITCEKCERRFAQDRIKKHMKVCKGKQYFEKKEHIVEVQKAPKTGWRKYHEEFINTVKYNRQLKKIQEEGGDIKQLGPPPVSSNSNYIQCPYCKRKFDPSKADKHISICQNVVNKPKTIQEKKQNQQLPVSQQQQQQQTQQNYLQQQKIQHSNQQQQNTSNPTYGRVFQLNDENPLQQQQQLKSSQTRQSITSQKTPQPPSKATNQQQQLLSPPQPSNQFRIRSPQSTQKTQQVKQSSNPTKIENNIFRPPTFGRTQELTKPNSQLQLKPLSQNQNMFKKF
ncbi:unnamed protein product [Paramecium pentaurelia]|uniref:C2HC/C3H-type domain-containing protein n=1 Tax=Paramecium pentaurelia TaxID=43138 RepID=A0A8S1SBN4_9CILI|nr:unnamed protein product [Paramecium pentaurelia]